MKNLNKLRVKQLSKADATSCNGGGIFKEGSFMDTLCTAISEGYRDFKAFLKGES